MDMNRNRIFLEKMMEAGKLQREALMLFLPDKMKGHLTVIGHELTSLLMDCVVDLCAGTQKEPSESGEGPSQGNVRKVDIG